MRKPREIFNLTYNVIVYIIMIFIAMCIYFEGTLIACLCKKLRRKKSLKKV